MTNKKSGLLTTFFICHIFKNTFFLYRKYIASQHIPMNPT